MAADICNPIVSTPPSRQSGSLMTISTDDQVGAYVHSSLAPRKPLGFAHISGSAGPSPYPAPLHPPSKCTKNGCRSGTALTVMAPAGAQHWLL